MSKSRHPTYRAEQRERARTANCRLFTLSISHPGGKPFLTYQGADNEIAAKLEHLFLELCKDMRRRSKAASNG